MERERQRSRKRDLATGELALSQQPVALHDLHLMTCGKQKSMLVHA